jgi:hypothetical protein
VTPRPVPLRGSWTVIVPRTDATWVLDVLSNGEAPHDSLQNQALLSMPSVDAFHECTQRLGRMQRQEANLPLHQRPVR